MMTIEQQLQNMPKHFPVVVIMQRSPSAISRWSDYQWQAIGVMAHTGSTTESAMPQLIHEDGDVKQYLYTGYDVHLYTDECEGYYYNLIAPTPCCYIITRNNDDNIPIPFLVTMSLDDAHAYMETDEQVYTVSVPPELYRWTENFVLMHYAPEKRKKRKRDDWKIQDSDRQAVK